MIIGTFTKNEHGGYVGSIYAANLHLNGVVFEKKEKGADFTLSAEHDGQCFEIGAAWAETGEWGDYLSVKLDSPVFPQAFYGKLKLKATDSGLYALTWNRPKAKTEEAA